MKRPTMRNKRYRGLYLQALKQVAKDAREISGGKIKPHLLVAVKSHAEQLAWSRWRAGKRTKTRGSR